ncbi:hypothetical protein [Streptomyces sp. CA2R101]|uniref:hypothetical protein n=1 Tax=Streptomyces sp. CA2R101 TaxID=3120152 RepID=UPI003008A97F
MGLRGQEGELTSGIAAAAAAFLALSTAGPASAAELSAQSTHRGTVGCFSYSWADGTATYTVYYHNNCGKKSAIAGTTNALFNNKWCANVNANSGGHTVLWNEPMSFAAAKGGRC